MPARLTWDQALAWRMRRQLLDPIGDRPVADVVRRLGAVQAQVASSAELAVRVRRTTSRPGEVGRALADGRLLKTWAMRGTLHLLTPEEGGAFLSLIASGRPWHRPAWQRYFGATPKVMEHLRETVRDALGDGPLTREELIERVARRRRLAHMRDGLASGWGTLLKPIAWQGDLAFAPSRGNRVMFIHPAAASSRWTGLPEPDEAAPIVVEAYLGAYGPATVGQLAHWLAGGWFSQRALKAWLARLGDRLVEVEVDGQPAYALAEHVDEMASMRASSAVRLLPGFDQYVLGPGTADGHVTPAARRSAVSRQAGWIAPVVVAGGVVSGTWALDGDTLRVDWFAEAGRVPRRALAKEVERLGSILGQGPRLQVQTRPA